MTCVRRDVFGMPTSFFPHVSAIHARVDSAAGAGEDILRISAVYIKRENVRIIDHAVVNRLPSFAAIGGFPGQVRCAGVNDIRILRIYCNRRNAFHFRHSWDRRSGSRFSRIVTQHDAMPRSADKPRGSAGSRDNRSNADVIHTLYRSPGLSFVSAFKVPRRASAEIIPAR